ncbi:hypothetical protein BDN70DRAFT_871637, partial [Pholiota conissans]
LTQDIARQTRVQRTEDTACSHPPQESPVRQATMACKASGISHIALPEVMHIQAMHPASTSRRGATTGEEPASRWETRPKRAGSTVELESHCQAQPRPPAKEASSAHPVRTDYTRVRQERVVLCGACLWCLRCDVETSSAWMEL